MNRENNNIIQWGNKVYKLTLSLNEMLLTLISKKKDICITYIFSWKFSESLGLGGFTSLKIDKNINVL